MGKVTEILRKGLIVLLRGYQLLLSPLLGQRCRFYPSCSHYAVDALRHHNLMKGSYLILSRLLRCHPFHPGGYDPVLISKDKKIVPHPTLK